MRNKINKRKKRIKGTLNIPKQKIKILQKVISQRKNNNREK